MRVPKLRHSVWLACVTFAIGLSVSPPTRADALDTVLDVLYKAGVIDGNVKAAKPLIDCLAKGNSVQECAGGAAGQTELANDPQVKNVLDIYQSFQQHDWYAVLKKAGITVGCALIPGGEVKDVVCGELGKIAGQVLDGVGSVLGAVGSFVGSMFGGGSDPAPMKEEDYYTLNFMPWYHWSVVHQLDNDTPANLQVLNAPMAACFNYFDNHQYSSAQANLACSNMRKRLNDTGYQLGNAFRDETESYFQLHFAPKVQEWAEISFNNNDNINIYAKQAMNSCLWDERQHIPLPNPGFEQCQALKQSLANLPPIFKSAADQMYAQCQAEANQRAVPTDNDAYTRICGPMKNRVVGQVILAMTNLKSLMNTAAGAGCPNNGYPKSIHCDSFEARDACVNAMPEHASMCSIDYDKAITAAAAAAGCTSSGTMQSITCPTYMNVTSCKNAMPANYGSWCKLDQSQAVNAMAKEIVDTESTADAPCQLSGEMAILCVHPLQVVHCHNAKKALGDAWGLPAVAGITCDLSDDAQYDQLKQQAESVLNAMNATYGPHTTQPCSVPGDCESPGGQLVSPQDQGASLHAMNPNVLTATTSTPALPCQLARHDPLVITCPDGFNWEAVPMRAKTVRDLLFATDSSGKPLPIYCPPDVDHDGAEAPCIEGTESSPDLPPAVISEPSPQPLQPVNEARPIQQVPAARMRRAPIIIKKDDGGGG